MFDQYLQLNDITKVDVQVYCLHTAEKEKMSRDRIVVVS